MSAANSKRAVQTPEGISTKKTPRISEAAFNSTVLLLYIAVLLVTSFHHERWRDEADTWLFVRDADYATIVSRGGYTGQMAPWYLLLAPLAKNGAPYWSIAVLNGLFAVAAVGLFVWKAPFERITRLLFSFSYFPLYEYGVIARTYAFSMFMLFVVATIFPRRRERPLWYASAVCLLSNLNVQGLFIAVSLTISYVMEARRTWRREILAALVMASGLILAYSQLRTPRDALITGIVRMVEPSVIPRAFTNAFLPSIGTAPALAPLIAGLLVLLVAIRVRRLMVPATVLGISFVLFTYLFVFKWPGSPRHHGFVFLIIIFVLWLARSLESRSRSPLNLPIRALLIGTLAWSTAFSFYKVAMDIRLPFSGSKAVAAFIQREGLTELPIAGHRAPHAAAVLPYLPGPKRMWFAGIGEYGSYLLWDQEFFLGDQVSHADAVSRTREHFGEHPHLIILNVMMRGPNRRKYELIYSSPDLSVGYDEEYYLYQYPARPFSHGRIYQNGVE